MSKITRIIIHWTAGGLKPNAEDLERYHYLIDGDGKLHKGKYTPEDNLSTSDGKYAAHTGGLNTGSIGIAVCGMAGFKDKQHMGNYPITKLSIEKLCSFAATLSLKYNIKITEDTVETHYEVGKKVSEGKIPKNKYTKDNIGKIDITFLPHEPNLKPDQIGNYLRTKIAWYKNKLKEKDDV